MDVFDGINNGVAYGGTIDIDDGTKVDNGAEADIDDVTGVVVLIVRMTLMLVLGTSVGGIVVCCYCRCCCCYCSWYYYSWYKCTRWRIYMCC